MYFINSFIQPDAPALFHDFVNIKMESVELFFDCDSSTAELSSVTLNKMQLVSSPNRIEHTHRWWIAT